jgi:uncharacterized protein YjbI with pentapeptide repeats
MLDEWITFRAKVEADKDRLNGADLSDAKLMRAKLSGAKLSGADLSEAYLMRADLTNADLTHVNFRGAVLSEADLAGADLKDAEFMDAYLCGANLAGVRNLTCDQLELANLDRDTKLPDYISLQWVSDTAFRCSER